MPAYTFRREYVRCGKRGCGGCPHGPYWYGYWREDGRVRKRYFGRDDPRPARPPEGAPAGAAWYYAIFSRTTANVPLARRILGVSEGAGQAECHAAYRRLSQQHHPDRGGDKEFMQAVIAAWDWLRIVLGWR